jgi:DNA-binding transcriptional MerR regulator
MVLSEDDVALVTAAEGARRLGISADLVRDWKRRGLLTVKGHTRSRRPLYSMRQLWDVEHETRHGQGSRRPS